MEKERLIRLKVEEGIVEDWVQRCKEKLRVLDKITSSPGLTPEEGKEEECGAIEEANAALLVRTVEREVAAIRRVAKDSKNLKGTFSRLLVDAASTIQVAADTLSRRSLNEETRRMAAEKRQLQQEVQSLRKELQEVKEEMRALVLRNTCRHPSPLVPEMEIQTPDVEMCEPTAPQDVEEVRTRRPRKCKRQEDNEPCEGTQDTKSLDELARSILTQVGTMMSARLEALESRLLPEKPLRPPLVSDGPADQRLGSDFPALSKRRERKKPIITENARLDQRVTVCRQDGNTDSDKALPPQADNMEEAANWTTITKRKPKKKRTATSKDASTGKGSKTLPSEVSQPKGQAKPREQRRRTRRAPRTAAVAIKGKDPQCSYAEILSEARRKISLTSLGIDSSKVRPAASGGVIIEIPGANRTQKADTLAGKLREAFGERKEGEEVIISRLSVKGELRIIGLDDSVDAAEVQGAVAEKGGCTVEEVRVGQIQRMTNGLGLIWVQCPLVAAVRMNGLKKFRLGWSTVKVELLRTRPVQCFKCWQFGHMRASCSSSEDRSLRCYRCGQAGHRVVECANNPHCLICESQGKESGHRLGSEKCGAKKMPIKSKGKAPPKRTVMENSARRTETMMELDNGD
ncbi:uncharacterized protein [Linepithema humile]|uniref:uncharacterized protein n=1 Tax=Linepithema humile TaxID=83485 RepID=UPI00351E17A0